jgi:hypothetical protein
MTITARVQNRTITLPADAPIADGTMVTVHIMDEAAPKRTGTSWMLKYAGIADDLPADASAQHDHYLYGTPKR